MATKSASAPDLAVSDIRRARSRLESEIFTAVNEAVLKFRNATGLMPYAIDVEISRNDTLKGVSYLPTGVSAKVEIP